MRVLYGTLNFRKIHLWTVILSQEITEQAGVKVLSWGEMLALGRGAPAEAIPPKPDDLCTIMYTSGTTGNPKA